jgi:hypothetical protein
VEEKDAVWQRGLAWVEAQLPEFTLPKPLDPDDVFPLKALGELARTADLLCRARDLPVEAGPRARSLLEFAWGQFQEGRLFAELLEQRPSPVLGTMYSIFEPHGLGHQGVRQALARLAAPGGLTLKRVAPQARDTPRQPLTRYGPDGAAVLALALALAWRVIGLASPWSEQRLFPRTGLAQRPRVDELDDGQAYSLTHAVFFMTDFGSRPSDLPAPCREYLADNVRRWAEALRRRGNHDLFAELALACRCIEVQADWAEAGLLASQAPDGMVPGPGLRAPELVARATPARRRFLENYHTTLAAIMASFAVTVGLERR